MAESQMKLVVLALKLQDITPEIWRILRVPGNLSLAVLHRAIQIVMGWEDYHLHLFDVAGALYGSRFDESPAGYAGTADQITLAEALERSGGAFRYDYDFGDGWRVRVSRAEGKWSGDGPAVIECLDGDLAGPKEDSGGPLGYTDILAATLTGTGEIDDEVRAWLGPGFDPRRFDRSKMNRELAKLTAVRRPRVLRH